MGDEVAGSSFTPEQRRRYRERVRLCLDVFSRMLADGNFEGTQSLAGLEVEFNLVDDGYLPLLRNIEVLEEIADPAFQTEIGAYNIELNVPPQALAGQGLRELEDAMRARLNAAEERAARRGAHIVMVGILPTLLPEHLDTADWMSPSARYTALNDSILGARGEDVHLDIEGDERLSMFASSIGPESACTSTQLHTQVAPQDFARTWNAAELLAAPQVALAANSPYLFGRQLWHETRLELFSQAIDTRPEELRNQGVRPRCWFGQGWISSALELFEENSRYFPSLLPEISDEDPVAELAEGRAPRLQEMRLHNGTIYRWNRPVYDVRQGKAHLRVENRVLPAGPSVIDIVANAAFYYGAVRVLRDERPAVWERLSFAAAEANFTNCARHGLTATVVWPGFGHTPVTEVLEQQLIPMADEGLRRYGVAADIRSRYLGIISERTRTKRNGAAWMRDAVRTLEDRGADRPEALTEMLRHYCRGMHANAPVHSWELP